MHRIGEDTSVTMPTEVSLADQRFNTGGGLSNSSWLTYTQGSALGAEQQPIASQGVTITQPVRIGRWQDTDNNWQVTSRIQPLPDDPNTPARELTPGIDGYNIDPVVAEIKGRADSSRDQVLVFSHSDTSAINEEDDLYLLNQVLVRSDLYYSYRIGSQNYGGGADFSAPKKVEIKLPAGQSIGISNNRPYLTPFNNTAGGRIRPSVQDLPPNMLLAWLTSGTEASFDADVDIAVTVGNYDATSQSFGWGNTSLIDPGEGIRSDDLYNLSLTYLDGAPVLSWSVATQQPYLSLVMADKPLQLLRLDEADGSAAFSALGELSGVAGQRIGLNELGGYSSPLPGVALNTSNTGALTSIDDGALWQPSLGKGDPNQALAFNGGEFVVLGSPIATRALLNGNKAPEGYAVELWIKPDASGNTVANASLLDAGLYNPSAVLPAGEQLAVPLQVVRTASVDATGARGWTYTLRVPANKTIAIPDAAKGSGLSPFNLVTWLPKATLKASFSGSTQPVTLQLDQDLLLSDALTYQTRAGSLSNLFSGEAVVDLWNVFQADTTVSEEQVRKAEESAPVDLTSQPIRFEQVKGFSLRLQDQKLQFNYGDDANGKALTLSSAAIQPGEWTHVQIGYGLIDQMIGTTIKQATLLVNGVLVDQAIDAGTPIGTNGEVIDYDGYDPSIVSWQLGYGFRGAIDEVAVYQAPPVDPEPKAKERIDSRFVNPNSASDATFFSRGRYVNNAWQWSEAEKFTYSLYLGASEPSSNRRATGEQVFDITGLDTNQLRADGFPDAVIRDRLKVGEDQDKLNPGSRLTGVRIESNGKVYAIGSGKNYMLDANKQVVANDKAIAGLVAVAANNTPTNALLNSGANGLVLDLPVLASSLDLNLFYADERDYRRGWDQSDSTYVPPAITYFYSTPRQQLAGDSKPSALQSTVADAKAGQSGTASLLKNPSTAALQRGSSFFDYTLQGKAIVQRQAPTSLANLNSGVQVSLTKDIDPQNSYAQQLDVGRLQVDGTARPWVAILSGQASLPNGSSIVVLPLKADTEADLQKLRQLDAGGSALLEQSKQALDAAGLQGLRINPASSGASVGSTLLWADLNDDGRDELIIGNAAADNGNGEVWVISGTYLEQVATGAKVLTLAPVANEVRRLVLPADQADRAGFGTSLIVGKISSGSSKTLVIGAPGQITDVTTGSRHGAVWTLQGGTGWAAESNALSLLDSGAPYVEKGGRQLRPSSSNEPTVEPTELQFGSSLAIAQLETGQPAVLLVGMPGLQSTYALRSGGHSEITAEQRDYYLNAVRNTVRDSNPPERESVTVESGGILAIDQGRNKQLLIVGQTFGGDAARAGEALASGGSFDGDAADDLAIGLPEEDNGSGAVALLRGSTLLDLLTTAGTDRANKAQTATRNLAPNISLYVQGQKPGERLGTVLHLDGNVVHLNQSNRNELVIGNPSAADNTGEIYVITGQSPDALAQSPSIETIGSISFHNLSAQDPEGRLTLTPGRSYAGFGSAISLADINTNGPGGGASADLVMATGTAGSTLTVLYGKDSLAQRERIDLRDIASGQGLEYSGDRSLLDPSRRPLGDFNGDGYSDVLLGAGPTTLQLAFGASSEAGATHPDAGTGGSATLELAPQLGRVQGAWIPAGLKPLLPQIKAVDAVGDLDGDGAQELLITSGFRDRLQEGEALLPGQSLVSANRKYILTMQDDGNLVLSSQGKTTTRRILFALDGNKLTGFNGGIAAGSKFGLIGGDPVYQRSDGTSEYLMNYGKALVTNFVGYSYVRQGLDGTWQSEARAIGPAAPGAATKHSQLILQDDGNLVSYGDNQEVLFALQPAPVADRLLAGEVLAPGESLVSANRKFRLTMQTDGNLVLAATLNSGAERILFALDGNKMAGFTAQLQPGASFKILEGRLYYQAALNDSTELTFAGAKSYTRMKDDGTWETVNGAGATPTTTDELIEKFILQDDGNLVGYAKNGKVMFTLQQPQPEISNNAKPVDLGLLTTVGAVPGALISSNPATVPGATYSLLYSDRANSNATLASSQVLERLDASALDRNAVALGSLVKPLRYIGTTWIAGQQALLLANPNGLNADHLVVALPNPNYRQAFSNTTALLDGWAATVGTNQPLAEALPTIKASFTAPAEGASVEERYRLALVNTALAAAALDQLPGGAGLGTDLQQYIAAQAPLYTMSSKTLLNPSGGQPFATLDDLYLLDRDGDGAEELMAVFDGVTFVYALGPAGLASLVDPATPNVTLQKLFATGTLKSQKLIPDVTGDGMAENWSLKDVDLGFAAGDIQAKYSFDESGNYNNGVDSIRLGLVPSARADLISQSLPRVIGDFNGDGTDDYAFLAIKPGEVSNSETAEFSLLQIAYGRPPLNTSRPLNATVGETTTIAFDSNDPVVFFGGAGDSNGDGVDDLVLSLKSGKTYTIFGGDFSQSLTLQQALTSANPGPTLQSITQTGTLGDDSIHGTIAGDTIVGREGSDLILGRGGPDTLNGGPGDDLLLVSDDQFRRIDGGIGNDRLFLNGSRDQPWDLTKLASAGRLANLETIDISDYGANTLTLNTAALLASTDSRRELLIEGDPLKRTPLQELVLLISREQPGASAAFAAYLLSKGITDESLRIQHDGKSLPALVQPYQGLIQDFAAEYDKSVTAIEATIYATFRDQYGYGERMKARGKDLGVEMYDSWSEIRVGEQTVADRYVSEVQQAINSQLGYSFNSSQRQTLLDAISRLFNAHLGGQFDTVVIHPDFQLSGDLVFNSDRFWLYTTLNGAARLLVRDGVMVERSTSLGSALVPTPWTTASTELTPTPQAIDSPPSATIPGPLAINNSAGPEDLRFSIDSPVVRADADRITFTVQRLGYLADISRLDFHLTGYTAALVPAAYGQVVFAPGETHRTLEIPLIQLDPSRNIEQLPTTEIGVELTQRPADAAGPRRTASYALQGLSGASETVEDRNTPLPPSLTRATSLWARGAALVLDGPLTSRETAAGSADPKRNGWIALGLGSLQGPGANDVYLRTRLGDYRSIYDPALSGDLGVLQDSLENLNTNSLFVSIRDGGLFDLDNTVNQSIDVSALPVLTSPGPVLLNNRVLRAPTIGDSQLWLDLTGTAATTSRMLLVPVVDANGTLPQGWGDLKAYVASQPAGLVAVQAGDGSRSQPLQLQPDTDYLVVLEQRGGTLVTPRISSTDGLSERSHRRYQLEDKGTGVSLSIQLSSNRWVMPGLAGQEPLLVASLQSSSPILPAAAAVELALVRVDGLSAGLDLDNSGSIDLRPEQTGYLAQLARRMGERDGMVVLTARQNRVPLTFHAGDALVPMVFEGISVADWLALPAEQRTFKGTRQGQSWQVAFDGQSAGATTAEGRRLLRSDTNTWLLAGTGVSLQIEDNLRTSPRAAFTQEPSRRAFSGFDRDLVAALGFADQQISDVQLVYKLDEADLTPSSGLAPGKPPISAVFDSSSLAGRLDLGAAALAPTLVEISQGKPSRFNFDPVTGVGARWYSLHGQGPDTIAISGRVGPQDAAEPNARLTMALSPYAPSLQPSTSRPAGLLLGHSGDQSAGYNVNLQFTLNTTAARGLANLTAMAYYLVPSATAGLVGNVVSREIVQTQGQKLFHTAPLWDQYGTSASQLTSSVQLPVGSEMLLVALPERADQGRVVAFTQQGSQFRTSVEDGVTITAGIADSAADLADFVARDQITSPCFNLVGLDQTVRFAIELSREGVLNSTFGFYRAVDIAGGVLDELTGTSVLYPGDTGYQKAALSARNTSGLPAGLTAANRSSSSTQVELDPANGGVLFPYGITNGITYLAFAKANPDGLPHFQKMEDLVFGYEDLPGLSADRDLDDVVMRFVPTVLPNRVV